MKITVAQLKQIIAEEIKRAQLTEEQGGGGIAFGDSPNRQKVRDEFLKLKLKKPYGEVPIQELAAALGVRNVNLIDFNGTGLRIEGTIVTQKPGDTPYRTDR